MILIVITAITSTIILITALFSTSKIVFWTLYYSNQFYWKVILNNLFNFINLLSLFCRSCKSIWNSLYELVKFNSSRITLEFRTFFENSVGADEEIWTPARPRANRLPHLKKASRPTHYCVYIEMKRPHCHICTRFTTFKVLVFV